MKQLEQLKNEILNHHHDNRLKEIYGNDPKDLEIQTKRYLNLIETYSQTFSTDHEVSFFSTPGRSEICGNHTDHQYGKVLAASINLDAVALVSKNEESCISLHSTGFEIPSVHLDDLSIHPEEAGTSQALIRGIAARLKELGYRVGGFNAVMTSDVLSGSGLSSSAAFEVLVTTIFSYLYNEATIDPVTIAQISQYAENQYFMKPCGLMDQCACSVGGFISIDFYHSHSPIVEQLDFDFNQTNYQLCISDTRGDHANLTDEYAAIPYEMKQVAQALGEEHLSHCDETIFYQNLHQLRQQLDDRSILRAIHLFEENHRVDQLKSALNQHDIDQFLEIINASGRSSFMYLQNIYANFNIQNQPVSLALALSQHLLEGKGAYRVHGGGFAGTIQAFVSKEDVANYKQAIDQLFGENSCHILNIRNIGSTRVF